LLGLRSRKDTMSSSGAGSGALFYMLFELTTSVLMAKRGYDQDQAQHLAAIDLSKRKYLMESFAELEQHFVSLYADLANTTRESERDIYDQRNQQLQTLVIGCSMMFTALGTIVIQGELQTSAAFALVIAFSITNGLAFVSLTCCLVLCIEVLTLTSNFMILKGRKSSGELVAARELTLSIFKKLKAKDFGSRRKQAAQKLGANSEEETFKPIAKLEREEIDKLWNIVEEGSTNMLENRRRLIGRIFETESFNNFWRNHCDKHSIWAVGLFYLGIASILFSSIIYIYCQFKYGYKSLVGALVGVGIIFASLIYAIRLWERVTRHNPESLFIAKGDVVEICTESSKRRIRFLSDFCTWRRCQVVNPAVRIDDELGVTTVTDTMTVRFPEDDSQIDVFTWQVRMVVQEVACVPND
jgi:hypothetical protein